MLSSITNFFTRSLAYSGDLTEGPFYVNCIFLLNVHVHMKLETMPVNNKDAHLYGDSDWNKTQIIRIFILI